MIDTLRPIVIVRQADDSMAWDFNHITEWLSFLRVCTGRREGKEGKKFLVLALSGPQWAIARVASE